MYSVRADKYGCTYAHHDSNVVAVNQTVTVNLTLRAPTAIQGTVTSCLGGPAAGVPVTFPNSTVRDTVTDANGHYYVYVGAGTYSVKATQVGCTYIQSDNNVVVRRRRSRSI